MYRIQINHRRLGLIALGIALIGIPLFRHTDTRESSITEPSFEEQSLGAATMNAQQQRAFYASFANLSNDERLQLKASKFLERVTLPRTTVTYSSSTYDIQVTNVELISGGIQVFARVWNQDGTQIGFGDGTVDIERFRLFNPPILVPDPTGPITREIPPARDGSRGTTTESFSVEPQNAILQSLVHTISVMQNKHDASQIIPNKVGNTTSTFYPDANVESTSVDGQLRMAGGTIESWATIRANTTATAVDDSGASREVVGAFGYTTSGNWNELYRAMYLFDTSAIPDTDTIDSATMSVYVSSKADPESEIGMALGTSSPTSNTALATGDFGLGTKFGTTALASDIPWASITASAYNDFALNATGLANISATGISKFGLMSTNDRDNSSPTWSASVYKHATAYFADQAGTTNDPKLVVVHSAAGGGGAVTPQVFIPFE